MKEQIVQLVEIALAVAAVVLVGFALMFVLNGGFGKTPTEGSVLGKVKTNIVNAVNNVTTKTSDVGAAADSSH